MSRCNAWNFVGVNSACIQISFNHVTFNVNSSHNPLLQLFHIVEQNPNRECYRAYIFHLSQAYQRIQQMENVLKISIEIELIKKPLYCTIFTHVFHSENSYLDDPDRSTIISLTLVFMILNCQVDSDIPFFYHSSWYHIIPMMT